MAVSPLERFPATRLRVNEIFRLFSLCTIDGKHDNKRTRFIHTHTLQYSNDAFVVCAFEQLLLLSSDSYQRKSL